MVFIEDLCTLQGPSQNSPLAIGRKAHGLYILDKALVKDVKFNRACLSCLKSLSNSEELETSCNQASKQISVVVWHSRVGHLSYKKLEHLSLNIVFKDVEHDMHWTFVQRPDSIGCLSY